MDHSRLSSLFRKYVDNTCSQEEKVEFLKLVEASENDEAFKALMDELWFETAEKRLTDDKANEIFQKITASTRVEQVSNGSFFWMRRVAAVLIIGMVGSIAWIYLKNGRAESSSIAKNTTQVASEHTFVLLPDGSSVILNSGSHLEYPQSFEHSPERVVSLVGEGFFDIKHDPSKPFIVRTGKLTTTVLGTAFNVKALAHDNNITVTVTRGKVKVSDEKETLGVLSNNQQIVFDKQSAKVLQEPVNAKQAVAWIEKDIFFDDVTWGDAAIQLEKRFDVEIKFNNEALRRCTFTATFVKGETLDQILSIICEFNKAEFKYDANGAIVIDGDGC